MISENKVVVPNGSRKPMPHIPKRVYRTLTDLNDEFPNVRSPGAGVVDA